MTRSKKKCEVCGNKYNTHSIVEIKGQYICPHCKMEEVESMPWMGKCKFGTNLSRTVFTNITPIHEDLIEERLQGRGIKKSEYIRDLILKDLKEWFDNKSIREILEKQIKINRGEND